MNTFTKEELIAAIEETIVEIENRIAIERIVYETRKEIWRGIASDICTPAHAQANMRLQFDLKKEFEKIKKETIFKKIIAFQVSVDEFLEEIDITSPAYNWEHARKFKTPDNPEFLKWLEEFKVESSKRKAEYLIKNANQLSEDNGSTSQQQTTVVRQSFC